MAKTIAAGSIDIPGVGTFAANAVPDPFDARDLEYRPKLQALPPIVDQRAGQVVLHQVGQSCTGHALAAVINTVLAHPAPPADGRRAAPRGRATPRVSPYMLYRLARRYDEFPGRPTRARRCAGPSRAGSTTAPRSRTSGPGCDMATEPDLDDDGNLAGWRARPLGRLLPGQPVPPRRRPVGDHGALRDRRERGDPRRLGAPRRRPQGEAAAPRHPAPGGRQVGRRPRLRRRRLQRGGVPGPELVGHGLGQGRLRDAALRGLVRLRLRRLGGPAGRAPHPVLLGSQPDPGGNRRRACHGRRPGSPAAGDARREPGQRRPALVVRQVRQHAGAGGPGAGAHGGLARLLARRRAASRNAT